MIIFSKTYQAEIPVKNSQQLITPISLSSRILDIKSAARSASWIVFTERGAIMAATILNSQRAVEMSVYVVRAFVQLRELLASNKELSARLDELEARIEHKFATHDQAITEIIKTIRQLMSSPAPKKRPIGFTANLEG